MGHTGPFTNHEQLADLQIPAAMVRSLEHPAALLDPRGQLIAQNDAMTAYLGPESSLWEHVNPAHLKEPAATHIRALQIGREQTLPPQTFTRVREDVGFSAAAAPLSIRELRMNKDLDGYVCEEPVNRDRDDPRLRFFLENFDQGVWDYNLERDQLVVSDTWRRMRGMSKDAPMPAAHWLKNIHPDDHEPLIAALNRQRSGQTNIINVQYRHIHADGHWIWILCRGHVMDKGADGLPRRIVGTDTDITDLKQSEAEVARLADKLQLAIQASRMGIWEFDPGKQQVHWDDRMLDIYGIMDGKNFRTGESWETYLHNDDLDATLAYAEKQLARNEDFERDYRILRKDGQVRHIRSIARRVKTVDGTEKLIGVNTDVTADYRRAEELEAARQQLEHDSRHDALTGLANRRLLDEAMDDLITRARATSEYAVMHVDLDHFKQINDTLGHDAGDVVLRHVAEGLRSHVGDQGLICRVGGDEFVVLFQRAPPIEDIKALADDIVRGFQVPFIYQGHTCLFGASIGIAVATGIPSSASSIFIEADQALYEAKNAGRSCVRVFTLASKQQMRDRLRIQQALIDAVSQDALQCFYQPQFDARSGALVGAEALVRWTCKRRGLLLPAQFMPLAHELGLVAQIDDFVLRKTLANQDSWRSAGLQYPRVSVNVSPQRLSDQAFATFLNNHVKPHHLISCELLESSFLDEPSSVIAKNMAAIRARNIPVEIDDFGAGHASIVAMQALRPDRIKVDRKLVAPVVERPRQVQILQHLVRIARLEGIAVTLEGIETQAHLDAIADVDCDVHQGFALGEPMSENGFRALLEAQDMDVPQTA